MGFSRWFDGCLAVGLTLFFLPQTRAGGFPLREYEAHVTRYVSSLEGLAVEFTATDYALDGKPASSLAEVSLISMAGHFRVKEIRRTRFEDGTESSTTTWILLRPDGYYEITEKAPGQFLLTGAEKHVTSPLLLGRTSALSRLMMPLTTTSYPIHALIRGDYKTTHSFKPSDFKRHPKNSVLALSFKGTLLSNGRRAEAEAELNQHWLITKLILKGGHQIKREISYTRLGERVLPERIAVEVTGPALRKVPVAVTEFRNYRVYEGSPSDFSLNQFGLPEVFSTYQAGSRWYLWFIAFGLLALALAYWFRRRVQRAKLMAASSTHSSNAGS